MTLQLVTAPAGSGKTQFVVERIGKLRTPHEQKTASHILVVVPSRMQLLALRERLTGLQGVTLRDFHSLYYNILERAGIVPHSIPEATRYRVLRSLLRQLAARDRLAHFKPIADKPGLITSVAEFIADLKQGGVTPDVFAQLATTPRARDLAAIYGAYQAFLHDHGLADNEGMGWLARDALDADARLYADFEYVAADGFDEFNPTQLAIIERLAARVPRLDVTLTYQPDRLAHVRFGRTFRAFKNATQVELPSHSARVPPLEHLERNLFELNTSRVPSQGTVTVTAAPDRVTEVRAIAREVKRLLVAGTPPERIAVLFRRLDPYHAIVREVFSEFGVPFRVESGMALRANPLVAALVNLLALSMKQFPWRDTLDALRSPYFFRTDLTDQDIARIETITRQAVVVRGSEAWRQALVKPTAPRREDERDERLVIQLAEAEIVTLRDKLDAWMARVSPQETGTVREFVAWVEGLIGQDSADDTTSLRVIACIRDADPELATRDLGALAAFIGILRGLQQAVEILSEGPVAWTDFVSDLLDAVSAASDKPPVTREGRVTIAAIIQARGVSRDAVFLGGLVESEFPPRPPEDPLLSSSEREALRAQNIPLSDLQIREETTLFYEAAALARQQLHLSYPYLDDDANALYPSPYVESVTRLYDDIKEQRLALHALPAPRDAASPMELAIALAHCGVTGPGLSEHSHHARAVEAAREQAVWNAYSGVIGDAALRAELAAKFGDEYLWSASQFNEWGGCGFRFFARRLLDLEETEEPEEGLDAMTLGALYHEILDQTYRRFADRGIAVTAATLTAAQTTLQEIADELLACAPEQFGFRPTAWWEQERDEILRRLLALLAAEAERNEESAPVPLDFEVPFGFQGKPALEISLPVGTIRVIGKIDRIDHQGDGVVLIDYKSGSSKIGLDQVIQGRNLQLPIYVLAAEGSGQRVTNAFFLHIRNGETSGELKADRVAWLDAAREHLANYVAQARAGDFAVVPRKMENGICGAYCEFASLCRYGRWSVRHA